MSIVAIVGRPNVGKSTLFNRLTESRSAIVDSMAGVTRDRHYGHATWTGKSFSVIDTGGYIHSGEDEFSDEIRKQVTLAIEEADIILFLVDATTGITDLDEEIARLVRKSKKKVFLAANKVDHSNRMLDIPEFYKLGLGTVFPIASASGSGTGELLDELVKEIKETPAADPSIPRIAIIGQPNTGKSSLLNTLIGKERSIVTPEAGTTRDAIDVPFTAFNFNLILVDTAGLRKKTNVREDIEFYSVMRTIRAIESSDVCLLLMDATKGLTSQDLNIFHLIDKNRKGVVILVNKWDLVAPSEKKTAVFEKEIKKRLAPFTDVPIVFTSVKDKMRIHKALEVAITVFQNRKQKIATSKLNKIILPIIEAFPPPSIKGKSIKIKYISQVQGRVPTFAFFTNLPQYIKEPYKRFIENKLRENFSLTGVPINIFFRDKDSGKET